MTQIGIPRELFDLHGGRQERTPLHVVQTLVQNAATLTATIYTIPASALFLLDFYSITLIGAGGRTVSSYQWYHTMSGNNYDFDRNPAASGTVYAARSRANVVILGGGAFVLTCTFSGANAGNTITASLHGVLSLP